MRTSYERHLREVTMLHGKLDIARWKSLFSLPTLREAARRDSTLPPSANIITGPYDIAVLEQLRDESFAHIPDIERVPTDVFVWNRGETKHREVTRIGGLPYLPATSPWPSTTSGEPMTFMAQICFADSLDIVPSLPGDILLIFAEGKEWSPGEYDFIWGNDDEGDSAMRFQWEMIDDQALVAAGDAPESRWQIMPCWAEIHRTWDYPTADGFAYPAVAEHIPPVFSATKISGVCPWLEEEEDEGIPGRYLCSLSSIESSLEPFPFLNVPQALTWQEWRTSHQLMIGDVGLMNFFLDEHGEVCWTAHSS